MTLRVFALLLPLCGLLFACEDPVRDDYLAAQGGEAPGVPPGPLHRPGQPCVLCHDGTTTESTPFAFAGTVYQAEESPIPLVGAKVIFSDSEGLFYTTSTNCAGNFFVVRADYHPTWPVFVKVEYSGVEQRMRSPMYVNDGTLSGLRDRSCAHCHQNPKGPASTGPVYFAPKEANIPFPDPECSQ